VDPGSDIDSGGCLETLVDEVDHPGEAVVDIRVDLEPAGHFQGREPVQQDLCNARDWDLDTSGCGRSSGTVRQIKEDPMTKRKILW
jgi:hypothetical protein